MPERGGIRPSFRPWGAAVLDQHVPYKDPVSSSSIPFLTLSIFHQFSRRKKLSEQRAASRRTDRGQDVLHCPVADLQGFYAEHPVLQLATVGKNESTLAQGIGVADRAVALHFLGDFRDLDVCGAGIDDEIGFGAAVYRRRQHEHCPCSKVQQAMESVCRRSVWPMLHDHSTKALTAAAT
jgi:hypothetical protein